ncbi:hypothetical protein N7494_008274 [Penicillium frequentans]|uniref:Uncharacterized protein n=1 Tax=Penicillium frequentans TaxID=3151616 RepID=A0AAD6GE90_9EURO|nr:hypothetical protein N7494_008274 [Penicillium glabrum]
MASEPILARAWRKEAVTTSSHAVWYAKAWLSSWHRVFADITIIFRSRILSRPSRVAALRRIGKHIEAITFKISHTAETFLPPVLDMVAGMEQTFAYMPQGHRTSSKITKYGSREMTKLLVRQYPPLFHASTDVPSFVQALSIMRNLRHLRINCGGQPPSHRYRRSVFLESLSLLSVHPGVALYLRPDMSFGASPASRKRWSQIRSLTIHMESFHHHAGLPTDHFKLLHAYLKSFPEPRRLVFHWEGERGLSPFPLATEPCLLYMIKADLSQHRPRQQRLFLIPLRFRHLEKMELANAITDASQIASFVYDHRHSLREFNFQNTTLRNGTWDDALAPLTQRRGQEPCIEAFKEDPVNVPIMLTPVDINQQQLQRVLCAAERQRGGIGSLAKARGSSGRKPII